MPEPAAVLRRLGPFKAAAAMLGGDRLRQLGLLGDGALRAVEFEEQRRRLAIAELGVGIDAAHHDVVEQLDARDRNGRPG